jgi:hypothetical protein
MIGVFSFCRSWGAPNPTAAATLAARSDIESHPFFRGCAKWRKSPKCAQLDAAHLDGNERQFLIAKHALGGIDLAFHPDPVNHLGQTEILDPKKPLLRRVVIELPRQELGPRPQGEFAWPKTQGGEWIFCGRGQEPGE